MRYGYHHARAADALAWLLLHGDEVPPAEEEAFLTCRAAVLAAITERCDRAVRGADVQRKLFGRRRRTVTIDELLTSAPNAMGTLLENYPRLSEAAVALTDVLALDDLPPATLAWREAARHSVLATETLVSDATWCSRPEQTWQVIADVADTATALVRLDRSSSEVLTRRGVTPRDLQRHGERLDLVSRHVGHLARSGDLDDSVDGLRIRATVDHPVRVRSADDLVGGTETLARLIASRSLTVKDVRLFAIHQAGHARTCADLVTDPSVERLKRSFAEREVRYRQLAGATVRTASVNTSQARAVFAQMHEIKQYVDLGRRFGAGVRLGVLADHDELQTRVSHALERAIRGNVESGSFLVVDDDRIALLWRRADAGETTKLGDAARQLRGGMSRPEAPAGMDFASKRLAACDLGASLGEAVDQARDAGTRSRDLLRLEVPAVEASAGAARRRLSALVGGGEYRRSSAPNSLSRATY